MAAPVATLPVTYSFRDSKGQIAKMKVIVGAATVAACFTNLGTLENHLRAISNAAMWDSLDSNKSDKEVYGTTAQYADVEDKAVLTYKDAVGGLHRFQVAAPKSAIFLADGETVDSSQTDVAAVNTDMNTFVYGFFTDTAPLTFVGGTRVRRKAIRRFNIWTKNPALTGPGV